MTLHCGRRGLRVIALAGFSQPRVFPNSTVTDLSANTSRSSRDFTTISQNLKLKLTFTCDSVIPSAYANLARSGPAKYLVCSKVFSNANICCPLNVGRVCFFFPSLSWWCACDKLADTKINMKKGTSKRMRIPVLRELKYLNQ